MVLINDGVILENLKIIQQDQAIRRMELQRSHHMDTFVMATVTLQDRRPLFGTKIAQVMLDLDENVVVRPKDFGKCPHCYRPLHLRFVLERVV